MSKDLRDPKLLGEALLWEKSQYLKPRPSLSQVYEMRADGFVHVPNYSANPTCIEKYGRPQDLPPTPF